MTGIRHRAEFRSPGGKRAFTMLELSVALGLSVIITLGISALISHQAAMVVFVSQWRFLAETAPAAGKALNKIMSQAEDYRVYATFSDAAGAGSAVSQGKAVRLLLPRPDGTAAHAIIAWDPATSMVWYHFSEDGVFDTQPEWPLTGRIASADFDNSSGLLESVLVSPDGSRIRFYGAPQ